jgi:hypothetical protein
MAAPTRTKNPACITPRLESPCIFLLVHDPPDLLISRMRLRFMVTRTVLVRGSCTGFVPLPA